MDINQTFFSSPLQSTKRKTNMKLFFLAMILFLLGSCTQSTSNLDSHSTEQKEAVKSTAEEATSKDVNSFIPQGYTLLDSTSGNLNLDAFPDMVLVLKSEEEDKTIGPDSATILRPLLILEGQANGNYQLAAQNNNSVFCHNCGGAMGDPYQGITIKDGYFSVEHMGGSALRWTRIITYKYSPAEKYWLLHQDGSEHFHSSTPEESTLLTTTTKDFGKVRFEDFDIYQEKN